jgi:hypothetical protein
MSIEKKFAKPYPTPFTPCYSPRALSIERPGVHTEPSGMGPASWVVPVAWDRRLSTASPVPSKEGAATVRLP